MDSLFPGQEPAESNELGPSDDQMMDPEQGAGEPDVEQYEKEVNLAKVIPEKTLKAVADRVCADKERDWGSSEEWRKKKTRWVQLFSGTVPSRNTYEKNLLFVHMPYLTKAVNLFHPRMHRHFFPPTGDYYTWDTPLPQKQGLARRATRHVNYFLRKRVPEYVPSYDRGGVQTLLYGSSFSVWYYNPIERRPCFEFINSDFFVAPYKCKSDRADMADVPRLTWIKQYHRHELEQMADLDYYVNVDKIYTSPYGADLAPTRGAGDASSNSASTSVQHAADQVSGNKPASDDDDPPRNILEQDRWLKLPGEKRQRPVTVCVDELTRTVLRLTLREKDDPQDAQRYKRDMMLRDAQIQSDQMMHQQALQEHAQLSMPTHPITGEALPPPPPGSLPAPPEMPMEPAMPEPPRKVAFNRFTHYMALPNPEGFYHYGIGVLVEGPNIVANEAMSGYASLMRLSQRPTGVQSRFARSMRGEHKIVLGEVTETQLSVEQVNAGAGIKLFQYPSPDPNAFKLEERMAASVNDITVDDVVGGAPGLSGQTATETEIRSSNAMEGISTIAARTDRSRLNEQRVFAYIMSQTLDEKGDTFFWRAPRDAAAPAWEPPPNPEEFTVTRQDYADLEDFDIVATCDPAMASQPQRQAKAMKIMQTLGQVPPPALDPQTGLLLWRSALHMFMEAMDEPSLAEMVRNAPPPPPPMMPPPGAPPPGGPGQKPGGESHAIGRGNQGQPPPPLAALNGNQGVPSGPPGGSQPGA